MPLAEMRRTVCTFAMLALLLMASGPAAAQQTQPVQPQSPQQADSGVVRIKIGYLRRETKRQLPISRLDYPAKDDGIAGAQLGISDNNTTGRFLKQQFDLTVETVKPNGDILAAANSLLEAGHHFLVLEAPAADVLAVADALKGKDALLFNIDAYDTDLRDENCRANVMHLAPSRAMLADALAQYLVWKRWNRWLLVEGANAPDKAMGAALRRAAKRFGARIVEEREYKEAGGASRTDSGHEQIQAQMPVFTQNARDHDVLVVADESEVFGPYLPYRTWDARPVAGTSGLFPASWHGAHEQWGATQFQNRFDRIANSRRIRPLDYHAWLALRIVGEAAQRERSAAFPVLRDYIRGPKLSIAGFKGQALTFRPWNNQLRQPIVIGSYHLPVTWSPQQGFLHQTTVLDTLGIDRPESKCKL